MQWEEDPQELDCLENSVNAETNHLLQIVSANRIVYQFNSKWLLDILTSASSPTESPRYGENVGILP